MKLHNVQGHVPECWSASQWVEGGRHDTDRSSDLVLLMQHTSTVIIESLTLIRNGWEGKYAESHSIQARISGMLISVAVERRWMKRHTTSCTVFFAEGINGDFNIVGVHTELLKRKYVVESQNKQDHSIWNDGQRRSGLASEEPNREPTM